jgi:hypothetical protein
MAFLMCSIWEPHTTVFYELGRNFWFYQERLKLYEKPTIKEGSKSQRYKEDSPFTTAFAILNRLLSMEAANVVGAPISSGISFKEFKINTLDDTFHAYELNKHDTWRNTIEAEEPPKGKGAPNYLGFGDFVASILNKINTDGGFEAAQRFWQTMGRLQPSHCPEQAMTNFLRAGMRATGKDYRALIRDMTLPPPESYETRPCPPP